MRFALVDKRLGLFERLADLRFAHAEAGELDLVGDRRQRRASRSRAVCPRPTTFCRLGQELARGLRERRHVELELEELAHDVDQFVVSRFGVGRMSVIGSCSKSAIAASAHSAGDGPRLLPDHCQRDECDGQTLAPTPAAVQPSQAYECVSGTGNVDRAFDVAELGRVGTVLRARW